jgi:hypothetical protein
VNRTESRKPPRRAPWQRRFLICLLCSAWLVTFVRCLHVSDAGYDPTVQIQAGQNLLTGRGLSVYLDNREGDDLAQPLVARRLAHFPCGYSLYAAALIALGASVSTVLKLYGAAFSLLGWWGWGRLALAYLGQGLEHSVLARIGGCAFAVIGPLLLTPPWSGTDIFLWAALPWVVLWLTQSCESSLRSGLGFCALAGAVCGLCVLMRYASLFLVVGCLLIILGQGIGHWRVLFARVAAFSVGFVPFLALQVYVVYTTPEAAPGGISHVSGLTGTLARGLEAGRMLNAVNSLLFFWMPARTIDMLTATPGRFPWQWIVAACAFALPFLVAWKCGLRSVAAACKDPRVAAAVLIPVLPLVLWGCMLLGSYNYLSDLRYYLPLIPLPVLVAWCLAEPQAGGGKISQCVRSISWIYLLIALGTGIFGTTRLLHSSSEGESFRRMFVGTSWSGPWPSSRLNYERWPARVYVADYLKEHPDTMLFTSFDSWFYADATLDQSRIVRMVSYDLWQGKYFSGPVRLLFMVGDYGERELEFSLNQRFQGDSPRVVSLEGFPDARLIKQFPESKIKVLEIQIPQGTRVPIPSARQAESPSRLQSP